LAHFDPFWDDFLGVRGLCLQLVFVKSDALLKSAVLPQSDVTDDAISSTPGGILIASAERGAATTPAVKIVFWTAGPVQCSEYRLWAQEMGVFRAPAALE
jgi:hypothetical protein